MIKRTDRNQAEIVSELRKQEGISVFSTHTIGKGFPDIVVGYKGMNFLFEIKDELKTRSQTKLTEAEVKFHNEWNGQVSIVKNSTQIIKLIKSCTQHIV